MLKPEITVYTGPMFSGKSSEVINSLQRFSYANIRALLFKPAIDKRYSETEVVNHTGALRYPSINITKPAEILNHIDQDVKIAIGIDEAMMFDSSIVKVCEALRALGNPIFISTLDKDYLGNPFSFRDTQESHMTIGTLLAVADKVVNCTAVCTHRETDIPCGDTARYTRKLVVNNDMDDMDDVLVVGGAETYSPVCLKHHPFLSNMNNFL